MKKILNLAILASLSTSSLISNSVLADDDYYIGRPSLEMNISKSFLLQNQLLTQKYDAAAVEKYSTASELDFATFDYQLSASLLFDVLPQLKMGFAFGSINPLGYYDESFIENSYKLGSEVADIKLFESSNANELGLTINNREVYKEDITALTKIQTALKTFNTTVTTSITETDDATNAEMNKHLTESVANKYNLGYYVSSHQKITTPEILGQDSAKITYVEDLLKEMQDEYNAFSTKIDASKAAADKIVLNQLNLLELSDGLKQVIAESSGTVIINRINEIKGKTSSIDEDSTKFIIDTFTEVDKNLKLKTGWLGDGFDGYKTDTRDLHSKLGTALRALMSDPLLSTRSSRELTDLVDSNAVILDFTNVKEPTKSTEFETLSSALTTVKDELGEIVGTALNALALTKGADEMKTDDQKDIASGGSDTLEIRSKELISKVEFMEADGVKKIIDIYPAIDKKISTGTQSLVTARDAYKTAFDTALTKEVDAFKALKDTIAALEVSATTKIDTKYTSTDTTTTTNNLVLAKATKVLAQAQKILTTHAAIKSIYTDGLKEAEVTSAVKTLFAGGNIIAHNFLVADDVSFEFGASFGLGQLTKKETLTLITDEDGKKKDGGDYTFKRSATVDGLTWFSGMNIGVKYAVSSYAKAGLSLAYQAYGNPNGQVTETWYKTLTPLASTEPSINGVFDKTAQANPNNKDFIGLQNFGISLSFSLSM